jgi:hypothetical protein
MFRLCICACLLFGALLTPVSSQAENRTFPYATAVQLSNVIDVLHCPSCSVAQIEAASEYYVRTAEGLNVAFARDIDAWHAARLLNSMVETSDQCDRAMYQLAFEEYVETVQPQGGQAVDWDGGIFRLLDPHRDLSSLAFYVMPPFRACQNHVATKASRQFSHSSHVRTKWARHSHGPLVSLRVRSSHPNGSGFLAAAKSNTR